MTPTQRTLQRCRDIGWHAGIVERFIPMKPHGIRKDLFGIIDIIAVIPGKSIVGIQSCGSAFSEHWKKITIEKKDETEMWLSSGATLELWGWRKLKVKRGGKAMRWTPRIEEITILDL